MKIKCYYILLIGNIKQLIKFKKILSPIIDNDSCDIITEDTLVVYDRTGEYFQINNLFMVVQLTISQWEYIIDKDDCVVAVFIDFKENI